MAVAIKNTPETRTTPSPPMDRLPVASLLGTGYVLVGLATVFYLLPALWWDWLNLPRTPVLGALLILVMVVTAGAWVFGAVRLAGTGAPAGTRAGVFCGLLEFLIIGLVTCGIGNWIEASSLGQSQPAVGLAITIVVGLGLLGVAARYYFHPTFKGWLVRIEEQGWFSFAPYKKSQGQRVRRGTILGILSVVGCGIYTMLAHRTLEGGGPNWQVAIPFSGGHSWIILAPNWQVAIPFSGGHSWIILPDVRFTVPILLAAIGIWFAYRVVSFPAFADFLIATEAELNKVSWSPWSKLKQDTIVVLVTVLLLTLFLFVVDQGWAWLLTRIGVVRLPDQTQQSDSSTELPW
jgi:preprotein translocase SecE subunit